MGAITAIGWTSTRLPDGTVVPGSTWNPWIGCHNVTAGCDFCYAQTLVTNRMGRDFSVVKRSAPATFNAPLKWERDLVRDARGIAITPRKVFACSLSDWFHPDADEWRPEAWAIIRQTPHLIYQVLTKRPNRIRACLPPDWGEHGYPNVWLGVTVESQAQVYRVDQLCRVPAVERFISYEPMLGPLRLDDVDAANGAHLDWLSGDAWTPDRKSIYAAAAGTITWVIAGGESAGPHERRLVYPADGGWEPKPDALYWARSIRRQCQAARVPFFWKQWGGPRPTSGGRLLDGREWNEMPGDPVRQAVPA